MSDSATRRHGSTKYEGWLHKKASNLTSYLPYAYLNPWRWRYCVAEDEMLQYYSVDPNETSTARARGSLSYEEIHKVTFYGLVQGTYYSFDVVTQAGRVYSFASTRREIAQRWVQVLNAKLQRNASQWQRQNDRSGKVKTPRRAAVVVANETDGSSEDKSDDDVDLDDNDRRGRFYRGKVESFRLRSASVAISKVTGGSATGAEFHRNSGWRLVEVDGNISIFHPQRQVLSVTQSIDALFQPAPSKFMTSCFVELESSMVFQLLMDVSQRKDWDTIVAKSRVAEVIDAFKDIVITEYALPVAFGFSRKIKVSMERTWWKELNGTYTIVLKNPSLEKSHGVCINWIYYRIRQNTSSVGEKSCVVSCRVCYSLGPYLSWFKSAVASFVQAVGTTPLHGLEKVAEGETPLVLGIPKEMAAKDSLSIVQFLREQSNPQLKRTQRKTAQSVTTSQADDAFGTLDLDDAKASELDYKYNMPHNTFIIPKWISNESSSYWWDSGVEVGYWQVRGPNYLKDKKKISNGTSAMQLLQLQWSFYDTPKRQISLDPNELVQLQHVGKPNRPFLLVINFMVPAIGNYVSYYCLRKPGEVDPETRARFIRMLKEFISGDDDFRNSKFKIIPSVVEGGYLVKKGVGSKPAILGKKIKTEYFSGDNYLEVCVDVGSSRVAGSLMGVVKSYASSLVIDLAFLMESQTEDELPEILIGGSRIHQPLMSPIDDIQLLCKSKEALGSELGSQKHICYAKADS